LRCAGEGGESVDDVLRRVRECIEDAVRRVLEEDLEESSGDATIAVVTHAGVLLLLREYLVDEDLSGEKNRGIVRNCSIGTMRVEVDTSSSESKSNTRWILDSWGKVDAEGTADVL
jgi:broad specificity phosphatase PhoE